VERADRRRSEILCVSFRDVRGAGGRGVPCQRRKRVLDGLGRLPNENLLLRTVLLTPTSGRISIQ
jgi:hypothetical protein